MKKYWKIYVLEEASIYNEWNGDAEVTDVLKEWDGEEFDDKEDAIQYLLDNKNKVNYKGKSFVIHHIFEIK